MQLSGATAPGTLLYLLRMLQGQELKCLQKKSSLAAPSEG